MLNTLADLVNKNLECVFSIFVVDPLPFGMHCEDDTSLAPVQSEKFETFSDLESFVRSIYIDSEADALLYGDRARYLDFEGVFCIDMKELFGVGYYINWDNSRISIENQTEQECRFSVTAQEIDITDQTSEDIDFDFHAINVNGSWKLSKLVY